MTQPYKVKFFFLLAFSSLFFHYFSSSLHSTHHVCMKINITLIYVSFVISHQLMPKRQMTISISSFIRYIFRCTCVCVWYAIPIIFCLIDFAILFNSSSCVYFYKTFFFSFILFDWNLFVFVINSSMVIINKKKKKKIVAF